LKSEAVSALKRLGFCNAPAIWQKVLPLIDPYRINLQPFRESRDILLQHLGKCGYKCLQAEGGVFLFPESPIDDDLLFVKSAIEHNLLLMPGSAFNAPGFFRISFCEDKNLINKSLPILNKLATKFTIG